MEGYDYIANSMSGLSEVEAAIGDIEKRFRASPCYDCEETAVSTCAECPDTLRLKGQPHATLGLDENGNIKRSGS